MEVVSEQMPPADKPPLEKLESNMSDQLPKKRPSEKMAAITKEGLNVAGKAVTETGKLAIANIKYMGTLDCILLALVFAIPTFLVGVLFSASGFGAETFNWLADINTDTYGPFVGIWWVFFLLWAMLCLILVVFDFALAAKAGKGSRAYIGYVLVPITVYVAFATAFVAGPWAPHCPLIVIFMHIPLGAALARGTWLKKADARKFYMVCAAAALLCGTLSLVYFLLWRGGVFEVGGFEGTRGWVNEYKAEMSTSIDKVWCVACEEERTYTACPAGEMLNLVYNNGMNNNGGRNQPYFTCSGDNGLTETTILDLDPEKKCDAGEECKDFGAFECEIGCYLTQFALAPAPVCDADGNCVSQHMPATKNFAIVSTAEDGSYTPYSYSNQMSILDKVWVNYAAATCSSGNLHLIILWASPVGATAVCWFMAVFCWMVASTVYKSGGVVDLDKQMTMFFMILFASGMTMWVAASVAGASFMLAQLVRQAGLVFMVMIMIWAYNSIGWSRIKESLSRNVITQFVHGLGKSDITRALVLCTMWPFIAMFLFLSMITRQVRKVWPSPVENQVAQDTFWFSGRGNFVLTTMKNWNWPKVLQYANYWCLGYIVLMVLTSQLMNVFLSMLNEQLSGDCTDSGMALGGVVGIYLAVGVGMFLLPPVPGVPVYFLGGILIVNKFWKGEGLDYWLAIFLTSFIGLGLKLLACTIQQKVIGECLGSSTKIRMMIGVHKPFIKAIEKILSVPGLTVAKVAVLVGGPDWPTSVTCGILKLPLGSVLLGTLPVYVLILPTVLAGAFQLKIRADTGMATDICPGTEIEDDGFPWQNLAGITILVTAIVQNLAIMVASYYVTQVSNKYADELKQSRPSHADVEALELQVQEQDILIRQKKSH